MHGNVRAVAGAIARRGIHTYLRRPDLAVPSLIFPLVFLASFAGCPTAMGGLPGFHFPAGYTAFQFVFVMSQSAMFLGLFTGFTLAFDFESGFARRLMLAAEIRRGIALGYVFVALTRAAITLTVVTGVALAHRYADHRRRRGHRATYGLALLLVLLASAGPGRGLPLPHDPGGSADADAGLPDPLPSAGVRPAEPCSKAGSTRSRASTRRRRSSTRGAG